MNGERTIKAFAFNACGFGNFSDAASLREMTKRNQQHARLVIFFERSLEVSGGEGGISAELANHEIVMTDAGFAFHWYSVIYKLQRRNANLDALTDDLEHMGTKLASLTRN